MNLYQIKKLEIINKRIAELENEIANSEQNKKENIGKNFVELISHMTEKQIAFHTETLEAFKAKKQKLKIAK